MKAKPVWKSVKPGHLADRNAPGIAVVNRAGTGEGPARRVGSGAKCVTEPIGREFEETRNRLDLSWFGRLETSSGYRGVMATQARGQESRVPLAYIAEVPPCFA